MRRFVLAIMPFIVVIMMIGLVGHERDNRQDFSRSCVKFPVVNSTVGGRVIEACARIVPGEGNVLLNINNTRIDEFKSQEAIVRAVDAAYNISGRDRDKDDVMIFINSGGTSIRGDSMGVAVSVAVLARLEGIRVRDDIPVTGAIKPNGRIGNVSGIREKAAASKSHNMTAIVVPSGLRVYNGTDIEDLTGIEIIEIEDINGVIRVLEK